MARYTECTTEIIIGITEMQKKNNKRNKNKHNLTDRELVILEKIGEGFTVDEICQVMNFSEGNFRRIYGLLMAKIGAFNRPNLIYEAFKKGILEV